MTWENAPLKTVGRHGFVYQITEKDTGKKYVGIKRFWKVNKLKPLKGMKNKRHRIKETDWRSYNSSSKLLQEKIQKNPGNYEKFVLKICDSQEELKCWEAWYQLEYYVSGNWNKLYNECINLRLRIRK